MTQLNSDAVQILLNQINAANNLEKQPNGTRQQLSNARFCMFENHPAYQSLQLMRTVGAHLKCKDPYFHVHDGIASATTLLKNENCINFSSYNYLNLNGDPRVSHAAINAINQYGTSVSASRLVSGERAIHQDLEKALAEFYQVDEALTFVSGHATNVTTIGHLFGPKDLVIHDEFIHNSTIEGIKLSGATKLSFPHNDWNILNTILKNRRKDFERVLIVIEGHYSMDGDYPELPRFIDVKKRNEAFLMVDEAHSLGVIGKTGRGVAELFNINSRDVDIWMGTLSKTLAGCGGYIAGCNALIDNLRYSAPGFVYSVGLSPALAAASYAALQIMLAEPERIASLHARATQFLIEAKRLGLSTGLSLGRGIIPIICGSSQKAVEVSAQLRLQGINAQPILFPAVPENQARLRFFISSAHTEEQIKHSVQLTADVMNQIEK